MSNPVVITLQDGIRRVPGEFAEAVVVQPNGCLSVKEGSWFTVYAVGYWLSVDHDVA